MSQFANPASDAPEGVRAYVGSLLGMLGDRDPLTVLRATPAALRDAVSGVAPRELSEPEAPGKWSVRQVLQHLADSELVGGFRFRMILAHDRPPIPGYDQDAWAGRLHYDDADVETSLGDFSSLRLANIRLFERASAEDLARVGLHSERGEESLSHLLKLYAAHDLVHLRQIERIRGTVSARGTAAAR